MIRKIPIIGPQATLGDIAAAIARAGDASVRAEFESAVSGYAGSRHIYPVNSGITAFYVILKALARLSGRTEVLLPAYTAGSLIVAVRKAGLKSVLYDISLKDFNGDIDSLTLAVSPRTLAAVCVHMFGIGMAGIAGLRQMLPQDVALVEDCAQAMGSAIEGTAVGNFGDAAFFSFNRGKNLPLSGGGFISAKNDRMAAAIKEESGPLAAEGLFSKLSAPLKSLAFSIAADPAIYGPAFWLVSRFKETAPPKDFTVKKMNDFQAALGLTLLEKSADIFSGRYQNGMALMEALKNMDGLILPEIPDHNRCVFSRLPLLFKEPAKRDLAAKKLWDGGVETSTMYVKPLHHMFDLGYAVDEFPNAVYCAQRLLVLPVHQLVGEDAIARMVRIIREVTA